MTTNEVKEYLKFMTNKDNSHKCKNCPENMEFDGWEGKLPCGQQHCWVDCHCEQ